MKHQHVNQEQRKRNNMSDKMEISEKPQHWTLHSIEATRQTANSFDAMEIEMNVFRMFCIGISVCAAMQVHSTMYFAKTNGIG